ncbi:unnamed protein product [Somion occarium]|uniref:Uncharacterized protein n=1 Tax=Somion occarium TaxID=3059160 RepID=A0ABP1D658_9APHY
MVHRPTDSRLLVNLLTHEKEYLKQLSNLLDQSQTSLASFSAYAAASAPPASQIIISVAGAFAGADEALRKYAYAVEQWQMQLKQLKEMEAEVANIMRDREILVTRLIKASKSQKSTRDNILASSSTSTLSVKPEVQIGSKLSAAQTELQACEAHLAVKERELDETRTSTIQTGLQLRCKAMVECGWTWGEMGKEGLRALDMFDLSQQPNGHAPSQSASNIPSFDFHRPTSPKPLPNPNDYTLQIPPAHSISEFALPNGHRPVPFDEGPGSSAEEDENMENLEVHENPKFAPKGKAQTQGRARSVSDVQPTRHVNFQSSSRSDSHITKSSRDREAEQIPTRGSQKRGSTGVFGSIAALFHVRVSSNNDSDASSHKWHTRTKKNLAKSKRNDDSSDDEPTSYNIAESSLAGPSDRSGLSRLRKRSTKRSSLQVPPSSSATRLQDVPEDRGWMSDGAATTSRGKKKAKAPTSLRITDLSNTRAPKASTSPKSPKAKAPNGILSAGLPTEASLSRNSSVSKYSTMSAPASAPGQQTTIHPASVSRRASTSNANMSTPRRRTTSLDVNALKNQNTGNVLSGHGYPPIRAGPLNTPGKPSSAQRSNGDPGKSLMSIVEDDRKHPDTWQKQHDPNRLLFLPKAPPPVTETPGLLDFDKADSTEQKEAEKPLKPSKSESSIAPTPMVWNHPSPPQEKLRVPLRSALRTSRSPSPSKPPRAISPPVPGSSKLRPPPADTRRRSRELDDTASISSYESFYDAENGMLDNSPSSTPQPAPQRPSLAIQAPSSPSPPPRDDPIQTAVSSDLSHSTTSHSSEGGHTVRKSVRMALPPTFSSTPPALDDDDDTERARYKPWSSAPVVRHPTSDHRHVRSWSSRVPDGSPTRDVWEDSSDEDEDYGRAKQLLFKFSRKA